MIASFSQLVGASSAARLDRAVADENRLHLRGADSARIARLLPLDALNALMTGEGFFTGRFKLLRDGHVVPIDMFVRRDGGGRRLDAARLASICGQGAAVFVEGIHAIVPAIAALTALLERRYRCTAGANLYAAFAGGSALKPHFDPYDVLVVQLHGQKRWTGFGQTYRHPVDGADFPQPASDPGPALWSESMAAGDLLYLPRGEVHRAEFDAGEMSVHLAIGLKPPLGADALRWLAKGALADEAGRESVRAIADPAERAAQQARLRALFARLAGDFDLDAFLAARDAERAPAQPLGLGLAETLEEGVRILPALRRRIAPDSPAWEALSLGEDAGAVLALLLERESLSPGEIAAALGWEPDRTIEAVRALAAKALVFILPDGG